MRTEPPGDVFVCLSNNEPRRKTRQGKSNKERASLPVLGRCWRLQSFL